MGPTDDSIAAVVVWAGVVVAMAGFVAAVAAQNAMGASWRIGVDQAESTDLVTCGVFAHVRNPIFTAMITAQLGTALMAPTWLSITAVVLLVVALRAAGRPGRGALPGPHARQQLHRLRRQDRPVPAGVRSPYRHESSAHRSRKHFDVEHCTFQIEPEGHRAHEPARHQ